MRDRSAPSVCIGFVSGTRSYLVDQQPDLSIIHPIRVTRQSTHPTRRRRALEMVLRGCRCSAYWLAESPPSYD